MAETADAKRTEKLLKKAKLFLDEKQKTKNRLQSLYSFLEAANLNDQCKFFGDYDTHVATVLNDAIGHQFEKIRERQSQPSGKEVQELSKMLSVLGKVFLFLPDKVRQGWTKSSTLETLQTLLNPLNHFKIRLEGIKLLLLYLNAYESESTSLMELYAGAVDLSVFEVFPLPTPIDMAKSECTGTDGIPGLSKQTSQHGQEGGKVVEPNLAVPDFILNPPISPTTSSFDSRAVVIPLTSPVSVSESVELFEEMLSNLVDLATQTCIVAVTEDPTTPGTARETPLQRYGTEASMHSASSLAVRGSLEAMNNMNNIAAGADSLVFNQMAASSALWMWQLFKKHYMSVLFPQVAEKVGIKTAGKKGFSTCPIPILESLVTFVIRHVLDPSVTGVSTGSLPPQLVSKTTSFLQQLFLTDVEGREFLHEIVRQCLLVPFSNPDLGRYALFVLRSWVFVPHDDRPCFMRRQTKPKPVSLSPSQSAMPEGDLEAALSSNTKLDGKPRYNMPNAELEAREWMANIFIRRYIRYIQLLFLDNKDYVDHFETQVTLINEAFQFYRLLVLETHIILTYETWQTLMSTLTTTINHVFGRQNKYASISSIKHAEELCDMAIETTLYTWVRSGTRNDEDWVRLRGCMEKSTRWSHTIHQWARLMEKSTQILSLHSFGIDLGAAPKEEIDAKNTQRLRAASIQNSRMRTAAMVVAATVAASKSVPMSSQSDCGESGESLNNGAKEVIFEAPETELPEHPQQQPDANTSQVAPEKVQPSAIPVPLVIPPITSNTLLDFPVDEENTPSPQLGLPENETRRASIEEASTENPLRKDLGSSLSMLSFQSMECIHEKEAEADKEKTKDRFLRIPPLSQGVLSRLQEFTNIQTLLWWNCDAACYIWKNMLCILGNVNAIPLPTGHSDAINCLVRIWESMEKIRAIQPYEGVVMPAMYETLPWLIKAADLSNEFAEGRVQAYSCVCNIMCRRHDQVFDSSYITLFYRLVIKGLNAEDSKIYQAVINQCAGLFTVGLHGCEILIPAFLKAIKRMTGSTKESIAVPQKVRQNAIRILFSLLSFGTDNRESNGITALSSNCLPPLPKQSDDRLTESSSFSAESPRDDSFELPLLEFAGQIFETGSLKMAEIRLQLKDLLVALIEEELGPAKLEKSSETHSMLIWGISVFCYEEMLCGKGRSYEIIDDCLKFLLDHLALSNFKVLNSVIDGLTLFALNAKELTVIDSVIVNAVVEKLVGAITEHLMFQAATITVEVRVSRLLCCLHDWIMVNPEAVLSNNKLAQIVFEVLENVLVFDDQEYSTSPTTPTGSVQSGKSRPQKLAAAKVALNTTASDSTQAKVIREASVADEETGYSVIKETAENILLHLIHHANNFAPPQGATSLSSQIVESALSEDPGEYEKCLYFSLNDTAIIALTDIGEKSSSDIRSRIIVRDMTGRYSWDSYLFYESLLNPRSKAERLENSFKSTEQVFDVCESGTDLTLQHSFGTLPILRCTDIPSEQIYTDDADPLALLLNHIQSSHSDCLLDGQTDLTTPPPIPECMAAAVQEMNNRINEQLEMEKPYHQAYRHDKCIDACDPGLILPASKSYVSEQPPSNTGHGGDFARSRQLLSHFGHLQFDSLKEDYLHILTKSPALYRDLKGLDKKYGREVIKVALIYVGPGQEDEISLLKNSTGSLEYCDFVSSLGWEIDVASHLGYIGGLEKKQATGVRTTYYCNATVEMIFHDVTSMPTDPEDLKQLKKKRHVGNDQVHIVWNEHYRDYRKNTIGGDFGNAQIVVTPLDNGLFAIDVIKDIKLPTFGPTQRRMAELDRLSFVREGTYLGHALFLWHKKFITFTQTDKKMAAKVVRRVAAEGVSTNSPTKLSWKQKVEQAKKSRRSSGSLTHVWRSFWVWCIITTVGLGMVFSGTFKPVEFDRGFSDEMYAYTTCAFVVAVIYSYIAYLNAKNEEKRSLAKVLCAVNVVAALTYLIQTYRLTPTVYDHVGHPVDPARFLEWVSTCPVLIYLISEVTRREELARSTANFDYTLIFLGFSAALLNQPYSQLAATLAVTCFFRVMYGLMTMFDSAIEGTTGCKLDVPSLTSARWITFASWSSFGIIFFTQRSKIISYEVGEVLFCVADIFAKVFLTLILVNASLEESSNEKYSKIASINKELAAQMAKADQILEKLIPPSIVNQLKSGKATGAEEFQSVTVFFSDITNMSALSSRATTHQMMATLNKLWGEYDVLCKRWGMYKVETIGDAFLGVLGAPTRVSDHAERAANFSIDVIEMAKKFRTVTGEEIQTRIGLNSGPITAGILGDANPHWCIVGDTVNTASRMESTSKPFKIHISESTYTLIRNKNFVISAPDIMQIKGKGEMTTYWIEGRPTLPGKVRKVPRDSMTPTEKSPNTRTLSSMTQENGPLDLFAKAILGPLNGHEKTPVPLHNNAFKIRTIILGQGSYGKVKLATDLETNQKVALKVIQKSSIKKPEHITRIKREVRIMRLLNHPNIVKLYDVSETEKDIVISMEYVEGGELFDFIVSHNKVSEKVARRIFRQIVSAVDYCHQSSVIHRDLKPENVLLDQRKNIKIIDFGFVNLFDRESVLKTFCGSPFYASPEMILGKQYVGPEVDIWSMGVILYALVAGQLPFRDINTKELYTKITTSTFDIPPFISSSSADLIKKMLCVDSKARITLYAIRHHQWINDGYDHPPESMIGSRPIPDEPLEENILETMKLYGFEPDAARTAILSSPGGPAFSLYYLLKEQEQLDRRLQSHHGGFTSLRRPSMTPAIVENSGEESEQSPELHMRPAVTRRRKSISGGVAQRPHSAYVTATHIDALAEFSNLENPETTAPTVIKITASTMPRKPVPRRRSIANPIDMSGRGGISAESLQSAEERGFRMPNSARVSTTCNTSNQSTNSGSLPRRSRDNSLDRSSRNTMQRPSVVAMTSNTHVTTSIPEGDYQPPYSRETSSPRLVGTNLHSREPSYPMLMPTLADYSFTSVVASNMAPPPEAASGTTPRSKDKDDSSSTSPRKGRRSSISGAIKQALGKLMGSRRSSTSRERSASAQSDDVSKPRVSKNIYGADTTSSKAPDDIVKELNRVFELNKIKYTWTYYKALCVGPHNEFEIEICQIQGTKMYGLELRRKKGNLWSYQTACKTLISQWRL
ncbi:Ral GTPase-activating protein subunit alpha-2 [Chytridiales sp. JEL 0842]|nr:Ral GTPase-activating protein subunit alpha-2 [Chytridiales sp. JEL 0842]